MTVILNLLEKFMKFEQAPIIIVCGSTRPYKTSRTLDKVGVLGKGKTDFSLYLAEKCLENGLVDYVASNIRVNHPAFDYLTDSEQLREWLEKTKGRKLFILDEAGIHLVSRRPLKAINVEMIKLATLLRKFRCKWILVAPRYEEIDRGLRFEFCVGIFEKLSKKEAMVYSPLITEPVKIIDIPKTSIPFDTRDIAPFQYLTVKVSVSKKCCEVWNWLREHNFSIRQTAENFGIHQTEVRRQLFLHIQHLENELLNIKKRMG